MRIYKSRGRYACFSFCDILRFLSLPAVLALTTLNPILQRWSFVMLDTDILLFFHHPDYFLILIPVLNHCPLSSSPSEYYPWVAASCHEQLFEGTSECPLSPLRYICQYCAASCQLSVGCCGPTCSGHCRCMGASDHCKGIFRCF